MSSRYYNSPYDLSPGANELPSGTFGVGDVDRAGFSNRDAASNRDTLASRDSYQEQQHGSPYPGTPYSGTGYGSGNGNPIYRPTHLREDDTVLACCNHAHEVARAHGAREVMLEHLVHAMARVPEAASVLEEQGIVVGDLRKESATVISSEIPVCQASGSAALRASTDFNTVMYLAAASASRRGERSTAIRDVLDVLLNYNPRAQAVQMLRKFAPHLPDREPVDPMRELRATLERQSNDMRDLRHVVGQIVNGQRNEVANVQAVVSQRLDALDRMISNQLGGRDGDRHMLVDHLRTIEGTVDRRLAEAAGARDHLDARLDRLEEIFGSGSGEGAEETKTALLERLDQIQELFGEAGDDETIQSELFQRLDKLEEAISEKGNDASTAQLLLEERFERLERVISDQGGEMAAITSVIDDRFEDLTRSLSTIDITGSPIDIEGLLDQRLGGMENSTSAKFGEASRAWQSINERMSQMEQSTGLLRQENQALKAQLDSRVGTLTTAIGTLSTGLGNRMAGLDGVLTSQHGEVRAMQSHLISDLAEMRRALNRLVHAQQAQAEALMEMRHVNSADLGIISNRLGDLENGAWVKPGLVNGQSHDDRDYHYGDDPDDQPPSGPSGRVGRDNSPRGIADRTFRALYGSRFAHAIRGREEEASVVIAEGSDGDFVRYDDDGQGGSDQDRGNQHWDSAGNGSSGNGRDGSGDRRTGNLRETLAHRVARVATQRTLLKQADASVSIGGSAENTVRPRTPAGPKRPVKDGFAKTARRKLASALAPLLQRPITTIAVVAMALGLIVVAISGGDVNAASTDIVGRPLN